MKKEDLVLLLLLLFLLMKGLLPPSAQVRESVSAFLGLEERIVPALRQEER